jgi:hypothetical protein
MPRTLRYLLVEDLGYRTDEVKRAASEMKGQSHIEIDTVTRVSQLFDDALFNVECLASYDGFFIDFHLSTDRLPVGGDEFTLHLGTPQARPVLATTGMGVLLYLRQVQESEDYGQKRRKILKDFPGRRPRPPLITFADVRDTATKFYAPAARSWFGAEHFRAIPNVSALAEQFSRLHQGQETREGRAVANATPAFEALMDLKVAPGSAHQWNHDPKADDSGSRRRVVDETYDWLRLYYLAAGKRGALSGFKDAVRNEFDLECGWSSIKNQYAPPVLQMQNAVSDLLERFSPSGSTKDWPKSSWSLDTPEDRRRDSLWDVLNASQFFWTEADVRFALLEHRARQGSVKRAGE